MSAALTRVWCGVPAQTSASTQSPAALTLQSSRTTRRQHLCGLGALLLPAAAPATAAAAAAAAADSSSSRRAETARIEAAYDGYAATYDELDGGAAAEQLGFPALRAALLAQAHGDVLETAVGTGLNLPLYDPAALTSLTAVDLSSGMLAQAARRAAGLGLDSALDGRLSLLQADVEQLGASLGDRQFDTVVDTFSLCVFPDPQAALRSMAGALRPGGTLLLLEHSRSQLAPLGWYQDVTAGAVAATGKGCRWNDRVPAMVQGAGLEVQRLEAHLGGLLVSLVARKPE